MIDCMCLVQAGQISDDIAGRLKDGLGTIARETFDDEVAITWMTVPAGSGFTGGELSHSSLVSMSPPGEMDEEDRFTLLTRICDLWTAETGCHVNDIVASAISPRTD